MELVILAGGMGSRFGGLKQLEPIDDNGNYIIDYSIYDAIRSGFDKIVFIINKNNYEIFKSTIGDRVSKKVKISYIFQSNDAFNINRQKPLGTGHAVLIAENEISDRFGVINADDFYGYSSFLKLAENLKKLKDDEFCTTVFNLKNTLSDFGKVTRGVCTINENLLKKITECEITTQDKKLFARDLTKTTASEINENAFVSMNMFGFNKQIFKFLKEDFIKFSSKKDNLENKEFYLPVVITNAITNNKIKVLTNSTDSKWFGLTYKEDIISTRENIKQLISQNIYPKNLWE